jgi:hypothetical protein
VSVGRGVLAKERFMTRISWVFAAAVIAGIFLKPICAFAAIELDPGLWQDTETGTEDGKPAKPEVTSDCMSPEEAKDPVKSLSVMKETGGQCDKLDIKEAGNIVTVVMLCGDPKEMQIDLVGTYTFLDRRHYTGAMKSTIVMAGKKSTADKTVDSKWNGPCKADAKKKK